MSAGPLASPPPQRGGNKIVGFIKRNKLLVGAASLGGGVLLLSNRGSSGSSDGQIVDSEGNNSTVSDGPVQLVPVSAPPNEGNDDSDITPNENDPTPLPEDQNTTNPAPKPPPNTTIIINTQPPTTGAKPPKNPAPGGTGSGVVIHGHFFPGATSHHVVTTRRVGNENYQIHLIHFPGRNEYWWYYTKGPKAGRWTGPHRGHPKADPPHPKPHPKPKPHHPKPKPHSSKPARPTA